MIYMVDHVYADPATEQAWHDWYAGYLGKLLLVPGIHTAQRFKAIGCTPSRYLAMYSVESAEVFASAAYVGMGGGGSQSARFHPAYRLWTRNLFEGLPRAPAVAERERLMVSDAARPVSVSLPGVSADLKWLRAVGLHMTTPCRALAVVAADEVEKADVPGSFVYERITPPLSASVSGRTEPSASS